MEVSRKAELLPNSMQINCRLSCSFTRGCRGTPQPDKEAGQQTSTSSSSHNRSSIAEAQLGDEELDDVFQELERVRGRWCAEPRPEVQHFKCFVLGGQWTRQNVGVAVDTIKARACGKEADQWCVLHGMPRSMSFAIRKYTEETAGLLGQAFCAVMEWFYEHHPLPEGDLRDVSALLNDLEPVQACRAHVQASSQTRVQHPRSLLKC